MNQATAQIVKKATTNSRRPTPSVSRTK